MLSSLVSGLDDHDERLLLELLADDANRRFAPPLPSSAPRSEAFGRTGAGRATDRLGVMWAAARHQVVDEALDRAPATLLAEFAGRLPAVVLGRLWADGHVPRS